jgi:hypothetical protein
MFYAKYNLYGSNTDMGMANTWQVASFETRRARDAWVSLHPGRLDVTAITKAEALKMTSKYQRRQHRHGGYLAHVHYLTDDNTKFVRAW